MADPGDEQEKSDSPIDSERQEPSASSDDEGIVAGAEETSESPPADEGIVAGEEETRESPAVEEEIVAEEQEKTESQNEQQSSMEDDPVTLIERVYQLWWHWADFELFIVRPSIDIISPPLIIPPEPIGSGSEVEFVYPIHDHGFKLSTSKAEDMYLAGMSMCKLFYTIEKIIFLLVERLKSGGISAEDEVQVAFGGHELAQRKAFESIINLSYNVVVTNFDPGKWGELYLQIVKIVADKGYGYPSEAPRDKYRNLHPATPSAKR